MKKERTFVNPFKLFFGASENYNQLSQTDAIDASNLSAEEKAELKKALIEFKGSILLVSHEPDFYEDWVDDIWNIEDWTTKEF